MGNKDNEWMGDDVMPFIKFKHAKKHLPMPGKMMVGQIIVRMDPPGGYVTTLKRHMRKAMANGMEFSIDDSGRQFAIRRDK